MGAAAHELAGGTVRPELHDVLASSDHTVALTTIHAARGGKQLQLNVVHLIHAANGKATEVWTQSVRPRCSGGVLVITQRRLEEGERRLSGSSFGPAWPTTESGFAGDNDGLAALG